MVNVNFCACNANVNFEHLLLRAAPQRPLQSVSIQFPEFAAAPDTKTAQCHHCMVPAPIFFQPLYLRCVPQPMVQGAAQEATGGAA